MGYNPTQTPLLSCPWPGKGFLAADESAGPWLRAGHAEAAQIPETSQGKNPFGLIPWGYHGLPMKWQFSHTSYVFDGK